MIFRHFSKKLQLIHLGGQGEIGKNMTLLRYGNNILIIDCGMKFPEDDMPGIDKVIPDLSYVIENKNLVRGLILTHGHEDHIGAIPYLLKEMNVPVYGTKLTLGILEYKLKEHKLLKDAKLHTIKPRAMFNIGPFKIEPLRVCHSIADAVAFCITTPAGNIVHTGDFKIDRTPIDGEKIDLDRFAEIGNSGVLLMLSDSTNADVPGSTPSEKMVGETFNRIFADAKGRILVASFASNIHRIQQVFNSAVKYEKKVSISGLSMKNVVNKARELGYLDFPKDIIVRLEEIANVAHNKLVVLSTGSQGEPLAALSRMAKRDHKQIQIKKGDTIVISATPIPGNETLVYKTIDNLFRLGADVIYEEVHGIHVSGHGCQDEMKLLLDLVKPKYFIPVHGEYRHQVAHAKIAKEKGISPDRIFITENGDVLTLLKGKATKDTGIKMEDVLIDGSGVGDIGFEVLSERRQLSSDGIVILDIVVSRSDFTLRQDIQVEAKGFIFAKTPHNLLKRSKEIVANVIKRHHKHRLRDLVPVKKEIQKELGKFLSKQIDRHPIILPVISQI